MDKETKNVISEQQTLQSLISHAGWSIARAKLVSRVEDLQNAFNIEDTTPEGMVRDLAARKLATTILFDFLRDVEGSASQAPLGPVDRDSYIVRN